MTGPKGSQEDKLEKLILSEAKAILREGNNDKSPTKDVVVVVKAADSHKNISMRLESSPPEKDTRLEDIVGDLPSTVLSRPGSPDVWNFEEKETSLKATPPRPTSATLCSPPVPRKVPISVDHHLRK